MSDAERDDRIVTPPRAPSPCPAGPVVSLSAAGLDRALELVVDLRFSFARLRLQLRDVEVDRG